MRAHLLVSVGFVFSTLASPVHSSSAVASTNLIDVLSNAAPALGKGTTAPISSLLSHLTQSSAQSATPNSAQSALSRIKGIFSNRVPSVQDAATKLIAAGLIPPEIVSFLNGYFDSELNADNNHNPPPNQHIYPFKGPEDAPYSLSEDTLRSAIHIPESFSYGRNGKTPVILVPGTAVPAGSTFHFSFSKLGDSAPVEVAWVNIPRASLSNAQVNAEYVAYAINYISALCAGKNVAVITWSQGSLDTQWTLKYWPSTRRAVDDFVAISPDYHGTIEQFFCPELDYVACTPSIWQQSWEANFIQTLRADDGDSAYVPTTTVYSSFDEIVEPQSGANASGILFDARGVGVTNAHIQTVCAGGPAAGFYTHEGVLYNPLAWALAIDAITHPGPANLSRVDLAKVCQRILPPALGLNDLFGTEGLLLIAVAEILSYHPRTTHEPPIKGYASQNQTR